MLDQITFGKRLRTRRKALGLRQSDVARSILVTEQAVSKWEQGESLPDLNNLVLLSRLLRTTTDDLLGVHEHACVLERFAIHGAVMELVQKPEMLLAGRMLYAHDYSAGGFDHAIEEMTADQEKEVLARVQAPALPMMDIRLSVNFWLPEEKRAYGFMRETTSAEQPEGLDIRRLPPSLYLRAYTDANTAQLLAKERCEAWELFAYLRNYVMPSKGLRMATNGAQEMEVFDTADHRTGYAYLPVEHEKTRA